MTIERDIVTDAEAVNAVGRLIASGAAAAALTRGQTTAADTRIAIAKTIEALKAWDLVVARGEETAQIVKEGLA